jgi:hypothetical protein
MGVGEPRIVSPEEEFQRVVVALVRSLLGDANRRFLVFGGFGVDIAIFIEDPAVTRARFLEVKVFAAGRPGGVGFGNQRGRGPQVDLPLSPDSLLALLDPFVRWVYADATQRPGSARYALFTCTKAKAAAMGGVARDKQNNLRISALRDSLVGWDQPCSQLQEFLLG